MIYFIIITALLVGAALMNEYGWADLTGRTRNSVVFETRNKAYGAYEIRQKYSNRLFIAFLGSLGILTLAAFSPKFFVPVKKAGVEVAQGKKPQQIITEIETPKEKEKPEEKIFEEKKEPAAPKKPDVSTVAAITPKPTEKSQLQDTTEKQKNAIVSNVTNKGDSSAIAINVPPGKIPTGTGGGGECMDCPPRRVLPPAEVTEQAEFDYQTFFRKNMHIPDMVYDLGINKTKVYVDFVLDEEGNVTKVNIRKGEIPALNDEVKRVASIMPKWKPAKFNQYNVKVHMTIPVSITFK